MDKKCPNCGKNIPEESSFCLHCFTPLNVSEYTVGEKETAAKSKAVIIILSVVIVIIMLAVIIFCAAKSNGGSDTSSQAYASSTKNLSFS